MNAPSSTLATCPSCHGAGERPLTHASIADFTPKRWRNRSQTCLSCKGRGQVEAERVCLTCGAWFDACLCNRHRAGEVLKVTLREEIPLEPAIEETADSEHVRGVVYDKANDRWTASIRRDGRSHYLGSFKSKRHAFALRMEAEHTPTDDFPALRARYTQYRSKPGRKSRPNSDAAPEPAEDEPEPVTASMAIDPVARAIQTSEEHHLLRLIARARAADDHLTRLVDEATRANQAAQEAEQEAVAAWNAVAEAVIALGGGSVRILAKYAGAAGVERFTRP